MGTNRNDERPGREEQRKKGDLSLNRVYLYIWSNSVEGILQSDGMGTAGKRPLPIE